MNGEKAKRSLARMEEITAYYATQDGVIAVAAFGSNAERERFDDSSDLDFLVFVEPEAKARLLAEASLLETISPVAGLQICCGDAVKLLFADGVLCDYGIVTSDQLATFPHGAGRVLWERGIDGAPNLSASEPQADTRETLAKTALFCLYVGILRERRGEYAAAFYEIQVSAAEKVIRLLQNGNGDAFSSLRRAECFVAADVLQSMMPGYGRSEEAARVMLSLLKAASTWSLFKSVQVLLD